MLLPGRLRLPVLPFRPRLGADRAGLAAEIQWLGCGTLWASPPPHRRGPWAPGLLVLAGLFRASPPLPMMLIFTVPSWEIITLRRGRSWHPSPRLSSGELGSNLYLSLLLMGVCSGVEQLSWLFAPQRSELPPVKATCTFSLPRSKKNSLAKSTWWQTRT